MQNKEQSQRFQSIQQRAKQVTQLARSLNEMASELGAVNNDCERQAEGLQRLQALAGEASSELTNLYEDARHARSYQAQAHNENR
ncbi:hypothetical protein LSG31_18100 [Fodinisporobacter ferrooxydans]|uniref:Methyl-accepting chemotaxis protein n=1 Tax=Fodinisporobacter ferrooxydans TaxID=2901836 RepID=A0ABY4CH08_9BACL|nr:hypothetical protein LSG31_18100 [Alicyclobacillaceae bacterium MYW30-H2]